MARSLCVVRGSVAPGAVRSAAVFAALAFFAGAPASASAQITRIINEVSSDGGLTWSSRVDTEPGSRVDVRVRVQLEGATALGLAGLTFQPTLSNWRSDLGDTRIAFTSPGLNADGQPQTEAGFVGRHVRDAAGVTGRVFPFGAAGQGPGTTSGLLTSFNDPGNILRFGGSKAIVATTNTTWGVSASQLPPAFLGSNFASSLDVVVFKYAVSLSNDPGGRLMTATVPFNLIADGSQSLGVAYYTSVTGGSTIRGSLSESNIVPATIGAPSPGATSLVLVAWGVMGRRKRR